METPIIFLQSIDLNFTGEATTWVEANPTFLAVTEQEETPTDADVKEFRKAVQARFPAKSAAIKGEDLVEEDITNLARGEMEDLPTYYARTTNILRRSNMRDTTSAARTTSAETTTVNAAERILLQMTMKAFVRGLRDRELRRLLS
ncbi:hypothetical protein K3495_g5329 [Podosphaera aphanis]|nr:hypothetical protein K3495_g5329 [Podosphaera aphanis]